MPYKTIYKYTLEVTDEQDIEMPLNSTILTIQVQNNIPCLWAIVDPNETEVRVKRVMIFGTGHPIDDDILKFNLSYIYTFQLKEESLVFHAFEFQNIANPPL